MSVVERWQGLLLEELADERDVIPFPCPWPQDSFPWSPTPLL